MFSRHFLLLDDALMHSGASKLAPADVRMTQGSQTWLHRVAAPLAVLLLGAIYAVSPNFGPNFDASRGPYGGDFLQEWIGGRLVLSAQADQLYDLDEARRLQHDPELIGYRWNEDRYLPMVYPPFYYALVSPLALLPMKMAAVVWAGLMAGLLAASVVLIGRIAGSAARDMRCCLPLFVLFTPIVENLTTNQKGSVLLLLFTATYALLRAERRFVAGLVFGLVAFKPQLAVVIAVAMLLKGQWRFVAGGAVAGLTLAIASLAVSKKGCHDYLAFSAQMPGYLHTAGYDLAKSHCWYGFFHLFFDDQPDAIIRIASGIMITATLFTVGLLMRGRLQVDSPRFALQFAGLVLATILVSPHLLTYDLTLLVLPAALIGSHLVQGGGTNFAAMLRALLAAVVVLSLSTPLARLIHIQISVPLMFAKLIAIGRQNARSDPRLSTPDP